jgi:hypothetical protein
MENKLEKERKKERKKEKEGILIWKKINFMNM